MKAFAALYTRLDATTSSNAKLAAMQDYFRLATPGDAAWAVYFLAGGRPRQLVPTKLLRTIALRASALPEWLFEESYQAVGDLAETITLLLPASEHASEDGLALWVQEKLLPLRGLPPEELLQRLLPLLHQLDKPSQLVCIKLITGSFRVGVSKLLVTRALAVVAGIDSKRIAQRLVGYTDLSALPSAEHYLRLIAAISESGEDERMAGQPYPFFLAHPLQTSTADFEAQLGHPEQWQIEWKWDGIRAQLVKRDGQLWIWSRGEDLVTDRFPELAALAAHLPDGTVIDGEIVVWKHAIETDVTESAKPDQGDPDGATEERPGTQENPETQESVKTPAQEYLEQRDADQELGQVQAFALLQQRIGRKTLSAKLLQNIPVVVLAYDLLEWQGADWRDQPQSTRRRQLELVVAVCRQPTLKISPLLQGTSWPELARLRERSRSLGVEGMMLKNKQAHYGVGRTKNVGVWWKWKIDPYTVDAVLIYAQRGHGRRASLYTDFTFAVWDAPEHVAERKLVPFAKAYSGLTDAEMHEVDAIIRKTTLEKFGPVRSVTPSMVFELGFEGIALSSRHKSGIAVRFPRMLRWRQDKPLAEADTLHSLRVLLPDPAALITGSTSAAQLGKDQSTTVESP